MSLILRIVIAIIIAVLITGILDYFNLLNHGLNVLLGVLGGLFYFFGSNQFPNRRV